MTVTLSRKHAPLFIAVTLLTITGSILLFMSPFTITQAEKNTSIVPYTQKKKPHKYIVADLTNQTITLKEGSSVIVLPILSQGKPGSYYETIGGLYLNDYKTPLHFSSIGHVYMPYSVHVFGQYFIHGVPYYPNGENVSTAYSGGCIRLTNDNAKIVYDFVQEGTPIIITQEQEDSFDKTDISTSTLESLKMTTLMVALVSLETLTQDNSIVDAVGNITTRRATLSKLVLQGDFSLTGLYTKDMGEEAYLQLMNQKAEALGLSNTHFENLNSPVTTTYDDYVRFMNYISTYKSYLLSLSNSKK
jgi:hypothetical protein